MVQAGEASGQIANVLENLSIDTQKAYEIRGKIKSAMIYPVVIFTLLIVVVIGMMVFVVPRLTSLFASVQTELPLITRIVIGLSNFIINGKFIIIAVVIAAIAGFKVFHKTDIGRYYWDLFKLKVPMFGKMFQKAYLARFSRTLSNLLNSGLSIVTTLQINANSMGNEVYRRRILLAMEDIKQGLALAESLTESYLFPSMLIHMIDVGEKTAQLDDMMLKVAHFYENELDTTIAGLSKILEPLILVFIGITVGGVVAAIMMPILQLSTLSDKL
jgi:type IV pilus assembly protein PilC